MNGNRGAKGSVNDRVISMLYRKRYNDAKKKKALANKEYRERHRDYLKRIKDIDIDYSLDDHIDEEDKGILEEKFSSLDQLNPNTVVQSQPSPKVTEAAEVAAVYETNYALDDTALSSLVSLGNKVMEYDPKTEVYDFDKFDYYELIEKKTGVASEDVIDVDVEIAKREDEIVILEEVEEFVDESKNLLSEIKFEIKEIKESVEEQHTIDDINDLQARYARLKVKLDKLREQYLTMKEKYDFEDYHLLESMSLITAVEDYRSKAQLVELENLVDACKEEVEAIDGVVIEEEKRVGVGEDIKEKKTEIKKRDEDFVEKKDDTIYYTKLEKQVAAEALEQSKIIRELQEKLNHVETETRVVTEYVYSSGRMFASFLRIASGILTAPLSRVNMFGMMFGTRLINRGLRDLRRALIPQEITRVETREKFSSLEYEIRHTEDAVLTTLNLVEDTLDQVSSLKSDFKSRFGRYADYIPDYNKVLNQMDTLESSLKKKKEEINNMKDILSKQKEQNKQKVMRAA